MANPKPIPLEVLAHCADALKVLAHPIRLHAVDLLSCQRMTVGELAEKIGKPPAEISQHLSKMKRAGLISVERDGQKAYYSVTNPSCTTILGCIRKNFVK